MVSSQNSIDLCIQMNLWFLFDIFHIWISNQRKSIKVHLIIPNFYHAIHHEKEVESGKSTTTKEIVPDFFNEKIREKLESQNVIKVIVLSVNPRSGSTYISEILSSAPMTSLWSEPLRFLYEKPPKEEPRSRKFFNSQLTTKKQVV